MPKTIVADTSALAVATAAEFLELLPQQFGRIILSPTVVDELVEIEVIDALVAGAVERIIEVVSLTQQDEELADQLGNEIAARSVNGDSAGHRGEAEALAIMQRADLEVELFLCDDAAALEVAREQGVATQSFLQVVKDTVGAPAVEQLRVAPRLHEPDEPGLSLTGATNEDRAQPEVVPTSQTTGAGGQYRIEVDAKTAALLEALVERGVGRDPDEVVCRAIRGLAAMLEL